MSHRLQQLERAYSEIIESHKAVGLYALYCCDMADLSVVSNLQILHDGSCGRDAILQMVNAEALHGFHAEVFLQFLLGSGQREHPVVESVSAHSHREMLHEFSLVSLIVEQLFRLEIVYHLLHIIISALAAHELARTDIEQRHAHCATEGIYRSQEVILLCLKHVVLHSHARCHKLCNATLHEFGGFLRVFELFAYSHTASFSDQTWQISVESVIWETSHQVASRRTVVAASQCDAQQSCCQFGILLISLVEVAAAE